MPRPTLASETAYLAHLITKRDRLARARQKLVAGNAEDRDEMLRRVDAWRQLLDDHIRSTKAKIVSLRVQRGLARHGCGRRGRRDAGERRADRGRPVRRADQIS